MRSSAHSSHRCPSRKCPRWCQNADREPAKRRTPSALPVAATAAAAGQEVERSVLEAATSVPAEELDSTLRDLVDARILQPVEGRSNRYRFRHELLREVAYELQPPSWRRKVHSRLCDLLSSDEPGDWRVLASHFERARRVRWLQVCPAESRGLTG